MIRITCTHCKAQLSVDEAFAGGVCRCQFCGTIQTVPKHLKGGSATEGMHAKSAEGNGKQKALYKKKTAGDVGLSSGLDAIAEVVASSGLSGSGLSSGQPRRSKLTAEGGAEGAPEKNKMLPILLGAGIVIILLLGVVIGMLMKGGGSGANGTPDQQTNNVETPPTVPVPGPSPVAPKGAGATFFGLKLGAEQSVVFVLDRGSGTHSSFEYMKIACANALEALRPEQKYQVVFWKVDKDKDPLMLPKSPVDAGNKGELKKALKGLDEVNSLGQSEVGAAMEKAMGAQPSVIVIATGKAVDESFVKAVLDARKGGKVKVHCVSLNEPSSSKAMQDVAQKTGGTFKLVSLSELQSVSR